MTVAHDWRRIFFSILLRNIPASIGRSSATRASPSTTEASTPRMSTSFAGVSSGMSFPTLSNQSREADAIKPSATAGPGATKYVSGRRNTIRARTSSGSHLRTGSQKFSAFAIAE